MSGELRLAGHGRALRRLVRLSATTLGQFVRLAAGSSWKRLRGSPPDELAEWKVRCTRAWGASVAGIVGMRLEVVGPPPPTGRLVVSNHVSYMDVIALSVHASGTFVAKSEVSGWPLLGRLARTAGTIFVERGRARSLAGSIGAISSALDAGSSVIVFPEGTSTAGDRVLPFRSPLLEVAARRRIPVTCASLSYATLPPDPPAERAVCWWGDMTLVDHLYRLLMLRRFDARLTFSEESVSDSDRKRLAARLHSAVCEQLGVSEEARSACLAPTS